MTKMGSRQYLHQTQESGFQDIFSDPLGYIQVEHNVFEEQRNLIEDYIPISGGMRVLDAGCGTGEWTRRLARKVGPNGKVKGVDLSPEMIRAARHRTPNANIEYYEGDVCEVDVGDDSFDATFASGLMMFVRDPKKCLAELRRLTRQGGWIILTGDEDLDAWIPYPFKVELWWEFKRLMKTKLDKKSKQHKHFRFDQYFARSYFKVLREAGLKDIQVKSYPFLHVGDPTEELRSWLQLNLNAGLEIIGGEEIRDTDRKKIKTIVAISNEVDEFLREDEIVWQKQEYVCFGRVQK